MVRMSPCDGEDAGSSPVVGSIFDSKKDLRERLTPSLRMRKRMRLPELIAITVYRVYMFSVLIILPIYLAVKLAAWLIGE